MLRRRRHSTPQAVAVTPATPSITHPDTQQFTAAVSNIHGAAVPAALAAGTWSSSAPTKATINASGLATSVTTGTSNINFTTSHLGIADASPAVLTIS